MNECENCIHADVSYKEEREIREGNVTIKQSCHKNIVCRNSYIKSISFGKNGDMVCSGFERRKNERTD